MAIKTMPQRSITWHTVARHNRHGFWLTEKFTPNEWHSHRLKKILVKTKTKFQEALIADSHTFGRCLVLDQEMQSCETDEFIYHEALIHPALTIHPAAHRVLILGGGEGATLREALRHPSVKHLVMVDIDGEVVEFAKKYLRSWHQNAFDDPRAQVVITDAKNYVENSKNGFWDVIFSDLPTPLEGGPAAALYTPEFYKTLLTKLSPSGIFVLQAGSGSLVQIEFHLKLHRTLQKVFKVTPPPLLCGSAVGASRKRSFRHPPSADGFKSGGGVIRPYYAFVPSYDVPWAFFFATQNNNLDPLMFKKENIDKRLKSRHLTKRLKFYDGETHAGLFHTPKYLRRLLMERDL